MSEVLKGAAKEDFEGEFSTEPTLAEDTLVDLHPEITGESDPVVEVSIHRESGQLPSGKRYQRETRHYPYSGNDSLV